MQNTIHQHLAKICQLAASAFYYTWFKGLFEVQETKELVTIQEAIKELYASGVLSDKDTPEVREYSDKLNAFLKQD